MAIHYLDKEHYLFGNKGAVWSKQVHINKAGTFAGASLCGTPGLSSNWAAIWEHNTPGCPECIHKYITEKIEEYLETGIGIGLTQEQTDKAFSEWLSENTNLELSDIEELRYIFHSYENS